MKTGLASISISILLALSVIAQEPTQLYGYVKNTDNSPARAVAVSIDGHSVATDSNGYYRLSFLKPGTIMVLITPRGKPSRSFKVVVKAQPTQRDFVIDW
jgi:hypothetical protein